MNTKTLPCLMLCFAAFAGLQGCSSAPTAKATDPKVGIKEFSKTRDELEKTKVISPGFRLSIRHSADAEISGEYRVDFKGMINMPYRQKMRAAGMTTEELADEIEKAYSSYFKVKNNVTVDIASREYAVEVRGLVQRPGIYTVKLDTSIEELMAMTGGLVSPGSGGGEGDKKSSTKPEYIRIVTPGFMNKQEDPSVRWVRLTDYFLKYDPRNEVLWRGGEQLFFQMSAEQGALKGVRSQTIQIMGEVRQPGEYPLMTGMDIQWYIGQAGGPTSTADLNRVLIIHRAKDQTDTLNLAEVSGPLNIDGGDVILLGSLQFKPSMLERLAPIFVSLGSLGVSALVAFLAL